MRRLEPELRGRYPTPIEELVALSTEKTTLWVKRDDLTHPTYGGNKIRKLERLLPDAKKKHARRIVTVGAAGSHHVLATTLFGRAAGFEVEAVLVPQPDSAHAEENLRADLAQGLRPIAARSYAEAALRVAARLKKGTYLVALGGSSVVGSLGYADAALELDAQVRAGVMPAPDRIVVAVGSGGTAAGLAAGLATTALASRVHGVLVGTPTWAVAQLARSLARGAAKALGARLGERLELDARFVGDGYAEPTAEGARAEEIARGVGLHLEGTYTAKAFASALDLVRSGAHRHVLYWHTLSSAPMEPLLEGAPALPASLRALLKSPR